MRLADPSTLDPRWEYPGWVATLGWQANVAAGVFFSSTILQGLLVLNYPSYVFERWHGTLLLYAALLLCVLVNTVAARLLPKIEGFIMILHILGFFAILIPLVYMAPHSSTSFVFKDFINTGGWSSPGTAWLVGLISSNLPFIGSTPRIALSSSNQWLTKHCRIWRSMPHG